MTPDPAIVYHRLQQLGTQALRMLTSMGNANLGMLEGWPGADKTVPAQYNPAHALSKQDGPLARAVGADSAALH